ncbi:MAG: phosphodiester glycosidase family protein [Cyanobacteria bacterium J06638_28]
MFFTRYLPLLVSCVLVLLGGCTTSESIETVDESIWVDPSDPAVAPTIANDLPAINYTVHQLASSDVHVVTIPPDAGYVMRVDISDRLQPLPTFARENGAIAAINAGFFDPNNGLTTSHITVDGQVVANPQQNPRLMENPDLAPYLNAILNRSEFRIYNCEGQVLYDITLHAAPYPANCTLSQAIGAGPQLLPRLTGYEEGFLANNDAGEVVRDAIGSQSRNARSAIGLRADGTVVLAMAGQRAADANASGLTLTELQQFLQEDLALVKALNLDGGSSAGLFYQGESIHGRFDQQGLPIERPIKSVLGVNFEDPDTLAK